MENKIDPFGFKGQAQDYDKERPRYPQKFIDEIVKQTPSKTNFIDIASGTGLFFYAIADKFNGKLIVNDRSSKQLQVAQNNLKDSGLKPENVEFVESDAMDIPNHLSKPMKFDLVAIAQALHWLDPEKFCQYVIDHLLSENGTLTILGYFRDGFDYNFPEEPEFMKSGQKHYVKFNSITFPYYDCDRASLESSFKNIPFQKYFKKAELFEDQINEEATMERWTKYLGTSSAYNLYKNKFEKEPNFEDPLQVFKKNTQQDLEAFYKKHQLPVKEKSVIMRMRYFMWILRK